VSSQVEHGNATAGTVRAELLSILEADLAIEPTRVGVDADLKAELGFDSLAFAIGIVAIEERLGLRLTEEQLLGCATFGDLEWLVVHCMEERAAGRNP